MWRRRAPCPAVHCYSAAKISNPRPDKATGRHTWHTYGSKRGFVLTNRAHRKYDFLSSFFCKRQSLHTHHAPDSLDERFDRDKYSPLTLLINRIIRRSRFISLPSMSHESVWNSRPRGYGKGARSWYEATSNSREYREELEPRSKFGYAISSEGSTDQDIIADLVPPIQPRLHSPCWSDPQVRPQHLPSVLP